MKARRSKLRLALWTVASLLVIGMITAYVFGSRAWEQLTREQEERFARFAMDDGVRTPLVGPALSGNAWPEYEAVAEGMREISTHDMSALSCELDDATPPLDGSARRALEWAQPLLDRLRRCVQRGQAHSRTHWADREWRACVARVRIAETICMIRRGRGSDDPQWPIDPFSLRPIACETVGDRVRLTCGGGSSDIVIEVHR